MSVFVALIMQISMEMKWISICHRTT